MKKCKELLEKRKEGIQDENLVFTLADLICHLKCCSQWCMFSISFVAISCLFLWAGLPECTIDKMSGYFLTVFSCTIGITIASYAIIIGLSTDNTAFKTSNEGRDAYHVICASMIFNGIIQLMTILSVFVFSASNCKYFFYLSAFLGCLSILQMFDILLQLLALRTFKNGLN